MKIRLILKDRIYQIRRTRMMMKMKMMKMMNNNMAIIYCRSDYLRKLMKTKGLEIHGFIIGHVELITGNNKH